MLEGKMHMPLNLLVLTSTYAKNPKDATEGTSYRCVGLYGSLIESLFRRFPNSRVFWYSYSDQTLRKMTPEKAEISQCSMLEAVLHAVYSSIHSSSYMSVIVAYPSIARGSGILVRVLASLQLVLSLLTLRIFDCKRIKTVIDVFDPPVELNYAFLDDEPSSFATLFRRALDLFSLKTASHIVALTSSYKEYISKIYRIDQNKITIVPCGSLLQYVPYSPPRMGTPVVVLYSGHATKAKDFDKLLSCITRLRQKGLRIELQVASSEMTDLPDWIHSTHCNWVDFVKNVLTKADIGLIPYPPSRLHFSYTMPAKLADYMAAGKPIVSTDLKETKKMITLSNCGLVARDWNEFGEYIKELCSDHELAEKLGRNGRKAAEENLNYQTLATSFLGNLIEMFDLL
jgi:glycosyltransferase involved in cell wall biosynthesis